MRERKGRNTTRDGTANARTLEAKQSGGPERYVAVDMLRGIALALMFIYHFLFDLNYFWALGWDFNRDWRWLSFRAVIVSLFTGLVGFSLVLADARFAWRKYLRRLALVGGCAALVSLGSYGMFPDSYIFFGILHFIFAASVIGLMFVRFYWLNLVFALIAVGLGAAASHPVFDQRALQWVGLMTHKPYTEDYVPIFPWFGAVLLGIFLGRAVLLSGIIDKVRAWRPRDRISRLLALGGRHSLLIYMLHQPIFISALYVIFSATRPGS
jgi:uncharacterized membrane protein